MKCGFPRSETALFVIIGAAVLLTSPARIDAQRGRGGPPPAARSNPPIDLTGYWVSLVTEDWRWRMLTPPKGSYPSIPLNAEGKRIANSWDPAKDEAAGEQCKAYGAANIMRLPVRLHITWENDNTLRIDTDAGMQTRLFHFGPSEAPAGEPTWQGYSVAQWEIAGGRGDIPRGGDLKVATTRMRPASGDDVGAVPALDQFIFKNGTVNHLHSMKFMYRPRARVLRHLLAASRPNATSRASMCCAGAASRLPRRRTVDTDEKKSQMAPQKVVNGGHRLHARGVRWTRGFRPGGGDQAGRAD